MMNFGNVTLRVASQNSNLRFRGNNLEKLSEMECYPLDNIWMTSDSQQKSNSINTQANHFRQFHNQVENRNYSFFVVFNVRKLDIYNY